MPAAYNHKYAWPWVKNWYGEVFVGAYYSGPVQAQIWIDQTLKKVDGIPGNNDSDKTSRVEELEDEILQLPPPLLSYVLPGGMLIEQSNEVKLMDSFLL